MINNPATQGILVPKNTMDTSKVVQYISLFTEDGQPVLTSTPNQVGVFGSADFRTMEDGNVPEYTNGDGVFAEALSAVDFGMFIPNGVPVTIIDGALMTDLTDVEEADRQAALAYNLTSALWGPKAFEDALLSGKLTFCIHLGEPRVGSPRPTDQSARLMAGVAWMDPIGNGSVGFSVYIDHLVSGVPQWGYVVQQTDAVGNITILHEESNMLGTPMGAWAFTMSKREDASTIIVWRRGKILHIDDIDVPWGTMIMPVIGLTTQGMDPEHLPVNSGIPIQWLALTDGIPLTTM